MADCARQQTYIMKVIQHFNMNQSKLISTLVATHFKLSSEECSKTNEEVEHMSHTHYLNAIDSLMYVVVCTRSNLSHAVSVVSRFISKLRKVH